MNQTLVLKPKPGTDVCLTNTSTGGLVLEIDARYLTNGAGGYEAVTISKSDAEALVAFINDVLIQHSFSLEAK